MSLFVSFVVIITLSTLMYIYLHIKTHIQVKFIYIDNVAVIFLVTTCFTLVHSLFNVQNFLVNLIVIFVLTPFVGFCLTMLRFWRTPQRRSDDNENEILSPADGKVIYIEKIAKNDVPFSLKGKRISRLDELTKTNLLNKPCWIIGINMTPFDVHKNCAPIAGKVVLNQHIDGKFLSLKNTSALTENERNTLVIEGKDILVGIIQIASRLVRRIDSYVGAGENIAKGHWFGMIRFGSQVDVIIPAHCNLNVKTGMQIYAGQSIIAYR